MKAIRDGVAVLAALIAVSAFVFSVVTHYAREKEDEIRIWQKTVVFEIVSTSNEQPISFDEVRRRYVTESTAYKEHILPKEEISPSSTRRILLELVRDGAIAQTGSNLYTIPHEESNPIIDQTLAILNDQHNRTKLTDTLVSILSVNPGKYTRKDLVAALSEKAGVTVSTAIGIVSKAIATRLVFMDFHNNLVLYLASDVPDRVLIMPPIPPMQPSGG